MLTSQPLGSPCPDLISSRTCPPSGKRPVVEMRGAQNYLRGHGVASGVGVRPGGLYTAGVWWGVGGCCMLYGGVWLGPRRGGGGTFFL